MYRRNENHLTTKGTHENHASASLPPRFLKGRDSRNQFVPAFERLRALVLLGGSVGRNILMAATGRSVLDLPIASGVSLIDNWHAHATNFTEASGIAPFTVRLRLGTDTPAPTIVQCNAHRFLLERDEFGFRGTAGVLHDISREYDDDDLILVSGASQLLLEPLDCLASELASREADIALIAHTDGTPTTLMLIRCGCLRSVPEIGYSDLKEQALPSIARDHRVEVVRRESPCSLPIRTVGDYTRALRQYHRLLEGVSVVQSPFQEDWKATFALVEQGAEVDAGARLHDTVVLRGAKVKRGTFLANSVVCRNGVVREGQTLANRLITRLV